MTLTCRSFRAIPVSNGEIRLEIDEAVRDAIEDQMSMAEIAKALGRTVRAVDKLSRRAKNPLPLTRGKGRPYILRTQLNFWLANTPTSDGTGLARHFAAFGNNGLHQPAH